MGILGDLDPIVFVFSRKCSSGFLLKLVLISNLAIAVLEGTVRFRCCVIQKRTFKNQVTNSECKNCK